MGATFVITVILTITITSKLLGTMADPERCPANYNSGCHRVCREIFVKKFDDNGRKCWGLVKIWGCGGHCLTFTVPDWQFPYKIPNHTVCIHDRRELRTAIIPHCEEGAAEGTDRYEYIMPIGCKCSVCNSSDTSCEAPRKRGKPLPPPVDDQTSLLMEYLLRPPTTEERRKQELVPQILQPPVYP